MKFSFLIGLKQSVIAILLLILNHYIASCRNDAYSKNTNGVSHANDINIHEAVMTNNIAAVEKYIAAKKNLNEKDPMGGSSPLITAVLYDRSEISNLLIKAGADINFKNNDGSTALHVAAFFCKPDMVKLLLKHTIDKSLKNKYSSTALETVIAPYSEVKTLYEQMKQMLEPMGVKLDLTYIEKTRPLIVQLLK